jgi:stage II sporulation protein D
MDLGTGDISPVFFILYYSYYSIEKDIRIMKLITNVFITTGILIGFPLLFYLIFQGIGNHRLPDVEEVNSGFSIKMEDGTTYDLDRFLVGVLPSEIDVDSSYEAVKAQAVIVRTSILRQMNGKKEIEAGQLEENYVTDETLKQQFGEKGYLKKKEIFTTAILETRGMAMQSDGEYIVPLYHEVSVGATVSAKELYGKDITYLQSAESTVDVESGDYMKVESWEYEDALSLIKKVRSNTDITEEMLKNKIVISLKTDSGYVKKMKVGKETFTGEEWKKIFDLNSTNFYIEDYDQKMRIVTLGKGHGLGLSQYGANDMAKNGAQYKTILKHYYKGIKITMAYE